MRWWVDRHHIVTRDEGGNRDRAAGHSHPFRPARWPDTKEAPVRVDGGFLTA